MSDLFHDPDYVHGQLAGLRALILAVAQGMPKDRFREAGIERLESVRTAMLPRALPENVLMAIDDLQEWVEHVTD